MSEAFALHPRLAADCVEVGRFPLSLLLLLNDANYPWFILVPRRGGVREWHELRDPDRLQLLEESTALARAMTDAFRPDKLNVAALGNVVPQLHVHHVARYATDAAWPAPVWGKVAAQPYTAAQSTERIAMLCEALGRVAGAPELD